MLSMRPGTDIVLGTPAGDVCDDRMFWPLVLQINSRCREKRAEAEKFMRAMDSTYIISSTLLNRDSYTKYHHAQRSLHASSFFSTAVLPPNTRPPQGDVFGQYATLADFDYLESLDYLQLYYPLFSAGYALAYAEYTQKFVLQYYGKFHFGSGTSGATESTCDIKLGTANDVSIPACQLTFEETLKSVFPWIDGSTGAARLSKVDDGVATVIRSSIFHPTRTGGSQVGAQPPTNIAETLTFKHIFGRGTLLSSTDFAVTGNETATKFHDLTPLSRDTGTSPTTSSVMSLNAYTNGKYTITDSNNLKQKSKKCEAQTVQCGNGQPACNQCYSEYLDWKVKVVSMEAKITSLKVIWKHVRALSQRAAISCPIFMLLFVAQSALTQSDNKLKSEQMLRSLLNSLGATSTSKPQFDVVRFVPHHLFYRRHHVYHCLPRECAVA
jgi:hypothetical protein